MLLQIDKLGKVAVTIEKDYWNINKDYDKLTVVEVADKFATYISRIPVPAGTELNNRKYWIPFSSLKEEIVIHYNEWINLFGGLLTSQAEVLNNIQKVINDIYTHLPNGIIFEGDIDVYDIDEPTTIHLTCTTTGNKPASEIKLYKNNTLIETWHGVTHFEIDETVNSDTEFRVEAVIGGWKYYGSWNVATVYPFYIGTGTDVDDIIENEDYKHKGSEGLNGIYQISPNDNDNIFIVAPKWIAIPEATMGGIKIPFDSATEYIINEIVYYVYKSSNQYQEGTYDIEIGSVEYDKDSLVAELLNKVTDISDEMVNYDNRLSEVERIAGDREESSVIPTNMGKITLPTHVVTSAYWALYTLTNYNQKMLVQVTANGDIWIPFDENNMLILIQDDEESFTDLEIQDVRDISEISTNYLQFDLTSDTIVIPGGSDVKISDLGAAMSRGEITDYTREVKKANILTQSMINKPNTIYVIQYDFDLNGQTITVPENCVLKFEGGSLSNCTIVGTNTTIDADAVNIFKNSSIEGKWNIPSIYPEWFGAKPGDSTIMSTSAIQRCLDYCKKTNGGGITNTIIRFNSTGTYYIDDTLRIYPFTTITGVDNNQRWLGQTVIRQTVDKQIFKISFYILSPEVIVIKNLMLYGNGITNENCIGITNDSDDSTEMVHNCTFENIRLRSLRYGIKFTCGVCNCLFSKIHNSQNDTLGIGIYINTNSYGTLGGYLWGTFFDKCTFSSCSIGGFYIRHTRTITTPCIMKSCSAERSGNGYNIEDYHKYGCFGLYYEFLGSYGGIFTLEDCYFEANAPISRIDEIVPNTYGYVEQTTPSGWRYIANPDDTKTANIIVKTTADNQFNVIRTNFQVCRQAIIISNGGVFTCKDCSFYNWIKGTDIPESWMGDAIINLDNITTSKALSIDFVHNPSYGEQSVGYMNNYYFFNHVKKVYKFINGSISLGAATLKIFCPILHYYDEWLPSLKTKELNSTHTFNNSVANVYVDQTASQEGNGLKDAPIKDISLFLYNFPSSSACKTIRFILLSNYTVTNPVGYGYQFDNNCNYEFCALDKSTKLIINSGFIVNGCICNFNKLTIEGWNSNRIRVKSAKICFWNCNINVGSSLPLVDTEGNSEISLIYCNWEFSNSVTTFYLARRVNGKQFVYTSRISSSILNSLRYDYTQAVDDEVNYGNTRPSLNLITGFKYFDTTLNKPIYWTGSAWVESDKAEAGVLRSGSSANRPSAADIYIGFQYFDTDLGTAIVYAGSRGWIKQDGFTAALAKGETSLRPTTQLTAVDEGYQYFDTDLGKPIYFRWNSGTPQWVDATGTVV